MRPLTDDELIVVHEKVLQLLIAFKTVCEENDIWYSLAYGTLLGAVREKGFIPWDTDADVVIRLEDKQKCREAFRKAHLDNIILKEHDNTVRCLQSHDSVCFRDKQFVDDIHVDVLPLVGAPSTPWKQSVFSKYTFYVDKIIRSKYVDISACKPKNRPLVICAKVLDYFIPDSLLYKNIRSREQMFDISHSSYVTTLANSGNARCCIAKDVFNEMTSSDFCGIPFAIPKDWDKYLRQMYGDTYMTPIKW